MELKDFKVIEVREGVFKIRYRLFWWVQTNFDDRYLSFNIFPDGSEFSYGQVQKAIEKVIENERKKLFKRKVQNAEEFLAKHNLQNL